MATPSYTRAQLQSQIVDDIRYDNIGSVITVQNILNRAARRVISDMDLRSTKRIAQLTPKLFDNEYEYTCPTDLKGIAICDIFPQSNRRLGSRVSYVTPERFDRRKSEDNLIVSVSDDDFVRKLKININVNDEVLKVGSFDSLTADGGTWALFGDAENVAVDDDQFILGSSVKFDISSSGGTTAGLQNTGLTTFDITDYVNNGSAFVWVYINSVADTGSDGLTNFILRIGNDDSNYYTQTITTVNDGSAFVAGWNLLRFDFTSMTQTGTVSLTACDYVAVYMTKETGKVDNGYRFDELSLHTGEYYNIAYYSKCPWQTSAGVYAEVSTSGTDSINADTEELDIFVASGKYEMFKELKDYDQMKIAQAEYIQLKHEYLLRNPSERIKNQHNYW